MVRRGTFIAIIAVLIAACSGNTTSPTQQPSQGSGATATPGATPGGGQTNPPNAGDIEAKVRALVPDGSTEVAKVEVGGLFQLTLTNPKSLQELESFWDAKIPSLGMTVAGKFTSGGVLTYSITNPNGGIVAGPDSSGSGTDIQISLGTSS